MDRRKFIGRTVLLSGASLLNNQVELLAAAPASPIHYVGIGRGACNAIDYLKKIMPNVKVTKVLGLDFDYETGKFFPGGEPPENILSPLVDGKSPLFIVYCLGGESNRAETIDFMKQLKQTERNFKVIVQFPLNFEGKKRVNRAMDVADEISLITPFKSVHAHRHVMSSKTLKEIFDLLNQQIVNLILKEVKQW